MRKLMIACLLALSFPAFAETPAPAAADAWVGARPSVQITVAHGDALDSYEIHAVVSDLRTGDVLAKPVILTHAGAPAVAEIGGVGVEGMVSVVFTVTVDASGRTAAYSSEVRDNAEVIASQSATLAVVE
jgi:hypothetical protein